MLPLFLKSALESLLLACILMKLGNLKLLLHGFGIQGNVPYKED